MVVSNSVNSTVPNTSDLKSAYKKNYLVIILFVSKWVGQEGFFYIYLFETGMNVVVKTKI